MKKPILILLILTFVFSLIPQADAAKTQYFYDDEWHDYNGNIFKLEVEGEILKTQMPPIVFDGYSVVPARDVFEKLGSTVKWEDKTQTVTVSKDEMVINVSINSKTAYVNGKKKTMPISPKLINGKTMIPVRFVGDTLGYFVDFNSETDTVIIRKKDPEKIVYITKSSVKQSDDGVTLTLTTKGAQPEVNTFNLDNPKRMVFDIIDGEYSTMPQSITCTDKVISGVRFGQNDNARIVFDVTEFSEYKITKSSTKVTIFVEGGKALQPTEEPVATTPSKEEKPDVTQEPDAEKTDEPTPQPTPEPFSIAIKSSGGRDYVKVVSAKVGNATRLKSPVSVSFELTGEDLPLTASEINQNANFVQTLKYTPVSKTKAKVTLMIKDNNFNVVQTQDSFYIMAQKAEKLRSVMIDAGHGGDDAGAVGYNEDGSIAAREKDFNLDVAIKIRDILKEKNVEVKMIRETDTYVDFQQVGSIANDANTTLFVSIHTNSAVAESANGIETWAYLEDNATSLNGLTGKRLAQIIQDKLIKNTKAVNRGVKNGKSLAVIKSTSMPAVLVEMGFISNEEERNKLLEEEYRQKIADAVAEGILLAFDEMGI